MRFVIVTGMSGAGRSTALKILEDCGYYCADNLPISLLPMFAQLMNDNPDITKAAVGIDIRNGKELDKMDGQLSDMKAAGFQYEILFMDASDKTLIKRYKETRRQHPMAMDGRVETGLKEERAKLAFLKKEADYIMDTSQLLVRELVQNMDEIFQQNREFKNMVVTVLSFGFKNGIPSDADLVFDVRFLPNPYYVDELKTKTGNDKEVQEFVMNCTQAGAFLDKLSDMVQFLIPNYVIEGKNQLVVAIGCTGGKHRSVTIANKLYEILKEDREYKVKIEHRDIEKGR
ncbi:MAG: RNase adapter RapZ [Lachnospiraceae bacterium]|nr:RNase adapter RapZ [Lachnospiraceae bacterium]MDD7436094.1 RNase adapter RapZ [Lachnospiraceae bacterium]MDY3341436.1 RNase adapter RapZ [Lachnospiraceae bacterium]